MKKQFFAACFVLLSAACASEQTTESTAIILDEHNMTDHTGTDFDLSAQVLKWDFILLEQNDSCRLTDIARIRFADDDIFVVNIEGYVPTFIAMTPKDGFSTESPGRTAITAS